MKTGRSALQFGQTTCSAGEAGSASSPSQARHLKCIIGVMKPLLVMLLIAASVHAQSIADIARKERERQSKAKSTRVIKPDEVKSADAAPAKPADAKPAGSETKEPAKLQEPPKVDPVQVWNNQLEQFRTKIRAFQDQETSLQLQLNQATNQFYAPVIDPATQQAAQAKVAQIQQQLADVRKGMDDAKKDMDALQLQGPPKK